MLKSVLPLVAVLVTCLPASGSSVSWGNVSLSDNNGGQFLSGFNITTSGSSFLLQLPNFSQSDFAPFSGEVDLGVTVTDDTSQIGAIQFTYFGLFDETFSSASYVQTSSGATKSPLSANFSGGWLTGFLTFPSQVGSSDLTTQLNLNDNGGLAGISAVRFDVVVPEPAAAGLMVLGAAFLGVLRYRRSSH